MNIYEDEAYSFSDHFAKRGRSVIALTAIIFTRYCLGEIAEKAPAFPVKKEKIFGAMGAMIGACY